MFKCKIEVTKRTLGPNVCFAQSTRKRRIFQNNSYDFLCVTEVIQFVKPKRVKLTELQHWRTTRVRRNFRSKCTFRQQ